MGATKTKDYSTNQLTIAALAKALGHPARVAIIEHLIKTDSCICNDIVSELPLSQPTVSQHLRELKSAGIISGEIEGNTICYCIDVNAIQILKDYINALTSTLTNKKNTCC